MVEILWEFNPKIAERNSIFVGRNKEIDEFENRKYDYDMETVLAYIAAGMPKIGRKSLLNHCFVKTHVIENNYRVSKIELGMYDGIEDLIIWINDLGFSDNIILSERAYDFSDEIENYDTVIIAQILKELEESESDMYCK